MQSLAEFQKSEYPVKSDYFATQLKPAAWRVFCAQKAAQDVKRAGGCEYWSFSLLAFSTRVIGMSR